MRPLFERFPAVRDRVPFEPLADLPTPVVVHRGTWVKCDNVIGGGKIRKLEFYRPSKEILAVGMEGSNWLRALALHRKARFVTIPQHHNDHSRRNVSHIPARRCRNFLELAIRLIPEIPGYIDGTVGLAPHGGSDPVTTLGYVNAAFELAEQVERGECPRPDAIFVPLGTCGTAAGLALGFGLLDWDLKVHAVRIAPGVMANRSRLWGLACQAAWLLDTYPNLAPVIVEKGFFGGYAVPTPEGKSAQKYFSPMDLHTSYSSKAAACLLARKSLYKAPLFWLTYGVPNATNQPG